ncbi:MAG: hypothetical protein Q9193_001381 [Seirophora villosa]
MAPTETQSQGQPVNLSSLPIPQLTSIKNQLTQELQHLTNSFTQLRAAQTKFRDCITSIRNGVEKGEKREGTGFYVEKTPPAAQLFYTSKVDELGKNLKDLEKIVQGKQGSLNVVEDVLRQKMINESTTSSHDAKGGGGNG